jgi:N-acetylglucosamine kinase-like BadF-type ATPase
VSDLLIGVDGGNSKTDLVLLDSDGTLLAAVRGPSCAPIHFGLAGAMDRLGALIGQLRGLAGLNDGGPKISVGVFALAGADLPHEEAELHLAVSDRGWVERSVVCNDAFALLRAGTDRDWGVAVVCGAGINCVGVAPGGAVARFPALGGISGDWGGGYDVGLAGLGAAVRAADGRGAETSLSQSVPAHFGRPDAYAVMTAMHIGELDERRVIELPPLVFAAARAGDEVASRIVLRLARELAGCATAAIGRLGLAERDVDVVLGGSLLVAGLPLLDDAVREGILATAPAAAVVHVDVAPVVGAALLALAEVQPQPSAYERVRGWGSTYQPQNVEAFA